MTEAALIDVLVDEITDGNTAFVQQLLEKARAAILGGGGTISPLTSASANGKSFTRDVRLDAAMVARACRTALAHRADGTGTAVSATSFDFSRLGGL